MRRTFWLSAVLMLAMLGSTSARAASLPNVQGTVSGIELCPQFICGAAVFAGLRRIGGYVLGRLCANADNTFDVETQLVMTYGGIGTIDFYGLLDHNYLIPRISGAITQ